MALRSFDERNWNQLFIMVDLSPRSLHQNDVYLATQRETTGNPVRDTVTFHKPVSNTGMTQKF